MNCTRFSEVLAAFEEGKLPPGEQSAAEAHIAVCPACRCLVEIVRGGIDLLPEDRGGDLTRSILERTTGPVCSRVESRLWDFKRGELGEDDSQLIVLHLEHCPGCRSVAEDITVLQQELPAMSELEPGGSFSGEVVSLTTGRNPVRPGFQTRLQAWWNLLVQRPLFSYEAAYVGTLVLMLAFSPFLPLRRIAFEKMPAVIQPSANYLVWAWAETRAPISNRLHKLATAVDRDDKSLSESVNELVQTCGNASSSILNRSADSVSAWGKDLIQNIKLGARD